MRIATILGHVTGSLFFGALGFAGGIILNLALWGLAIAAYAGYEYWPTVPWLIGGACTLFALGRGWR